MTDLHHLNRQLADLRRQKRILRKQQPRIRAKKVKPEGKGQREPRVRDNKHLAFVRRLPCACCGRLGPSDAAHLRTANPAIGKRHTGKAEKPSDCWTAPLARRCHERQHSMAELAFWASVGIDPFDLCQRLYAVSGDEAAALQILREVRQ